MKNKINYEKGFTLLELLVVVLIIGILATVALPLLIAVNWTISPLISKGEPVHEHSKRKILHFRG